MKIFDNILETIGNRLSVHTPILSVGLPGFVFVSAKGEPFNPASCVKDHISSQAMVARSCTKVKYQFDGV